MVDMFARLSWLNHTQSNKPPYRSMGHRETNYHVSWIYSTLGILFGICRSRLMIRSNIFSSTFSHTWRYALTSCFPLSHVLDATLFDNDDDDDDDDNNNNNNILWHRRCAELYNKQLDWKSQQEMAQPLQHSMAIAIFFGDVSGENKVVIGNVANVNPGLINPVYGCLIGGVPFKYQIMGYASNMTVQINELASLRSLASSCSPSACTARRWSPSPPERSDTPCRVKRGSPVVRPETRM